MPTDLCRQLLHVHILGAGVGESIVLRTPYGKWGVVDCYARSLDDPLTNPTLCLLRELGVAELEFLCLTHPHEDHFRGMSQILRAMPVSYFWRFGAMSPGDLSLLVEYLVLQADRSKARAAVGNAREFHAILRLVREGARKRRRTLHQKRVVGPQPLYPVPVDRNAEFQIWSLAPSGDQVDRYELALKNCFTKEGEIREEMPHSRHNLVSVALMVSYGQTHIVLGGDVEEAGWRDVIREFGSQRLGSQCVKVSHHGSRNGYCENLWSHFARGGKPIAVVCPFQPRGLPHKEAIEHIRRHADPVITTFAPGVSAEQLPSTQLSRAPVKSRAAIRANFHAVHAAETEESGSCLFVFDDMGRVVQSSIDPPAATLPL